jgi:hypothetical protein
MRDAVRDAIQVLRQPAPIRIHQVDALPALSAAFRALGSPVALGVAKANLARARGAITVASS